MSKYQSVGHCKKCGWTWVIGDASVIASKRHSRDGNPPGLKCPFCEAGGQAIRIEKEYKGED